jgi:hypothetical protein
MSESHDKNLTSCHRRASADHHRVPGRYLSPNFGVAKFIFRKLKFSKMSFNTLSNESPSAKLCFQKIPPDRTPNDGV